jgi:hypothetical protein
MSRGKSTKLKPFQKILMVMASGKPVTVEEIDALLGNEIYMYRLSTYMWHIKTVANGVVKSIKDGRKVTAYQIINVDEMAKYMSRVGVVASALLHPAKTKKPSTAKITKLADLKAKPIAPVKKVAPVVTEELVVTEITD